MGELDWLMQQGQYENGWLWLADAARSKRKWMNLIGWYSKANPKMSEFDWLGQQGHERKWMNLIGWCNKVNRKMSEYDWANKKIGEFDWSIQHGYTKMGEFDWLMISYLIRRVPSFAIVDNVSIPTSYCYNNKKGNYL